jgi:hypothetical protein
MTHGPRVVRSGCRFLHPECFQQLSCRRLCNSRSHETPQHARLRRPADGTRMHPKTAPKSPPPPNSLRLRDLIAVIEVCGRYWTDEQIESEIQRAYRLAAEGRRPAADVEGARAERDLGRTPR